MKFRVEIGVLAGTFASQHLAFAHLLDATPEADFDQVEVLQAPFDTRLAGYFAPEVVQTLAHQDADTTLVLLLPGCGVPLAATDHLFVVGRFPGTLTRALFPTE